MSNVHRKDGGGWAERKHAKTHTLGRKGESERSGENVSDGASS